MMKTGLLILLALFSGCATNESVEILQGRINSLEARLSKNELAQTGTETNLKRVENEVGKLASIKTEVNALHSETHSAFKLIATKLGEIKKQLRAYQITKPRAASSASIPTPSPLRD